MPARTGLTPIAQLEATPPAIFKKDRLFMIVSFSSDIPFRVVNSRD
jgi:hypothetical protein